jgi:hypothetical protein
VRGALLISENHKPAANYDESGQAERRSAKREKVSVSWPPVECIALVFTRKLEDEN